jgi:hypothetical protein
MSARSTRSWITSMCGITLSAPAPVEPGAPVAAVEAPAACRAR